MTHRFITVFSLIAVAAGASAQIDPTLAAYALEAADRRPLVAARRLAFAEAEAAARALGAPRNPELEVAPGIGFTNSNFLIGQSFDISGLRAARARRARFEAEAARSEWTSARMSAAVAVLDALAELRAARAHVAEARAGLENATGIVQAVRKRVEVGEAPEVQRIRAELEQGRANQMLLAAQRDEKSANAALLSLTGSPPDRSAPLLDWRPIAIASDAERSFLERHPAFQVAQAKIESARAGEVEAKRQGRPSLFAGLATDTWSLDRRPFDRENFGFQVRLSMPLFDRGENRETVRAAGFARQSRESELAETKRALTLELDTARGELESAQTAAKTYSDDLLPKARDLVERLRSAFEAGLTSFLDVLEAQKAMAQLRAEAAVARRDLARAEVRYLAAAALIIPGLEKTR